MDVVDAIDKQAAACARCRVDRYFEDHPRISPRARLESFRIGDDPGYASPGLGDEQTDGSSAVSHLGDKLIGAEPVRVVVHVRGQDQLVGGRPCLQVEQPVMHRLG